MLIINFKLVLIFVFVLWLVILPKEVSAKLVINEFSSSSNSDWIEIFNSGPESISLDGYKIVDVTGNSKNFSGEILAGAFTFVTFSNWLNNDTDTIKLVKSTGEEVDIISYGGSNQNCAPGNNESIGRLPDGGNNIVRFASTTQNSTNNSIVNPCSVPTITLSPTVTPAVTTVENKAVYKINNVKDDSGNQLNTVEIYVDGKYTHHYAPETLTFCDDCHCDPDNQVDCGLGEHLVSLQKDSYEEWSLVKDFNTGVNEEVTPIMEFVPTNTPTVKPTTTPKPTNTPTPKITIVITPTETAASESGEILGESDQTPAFYPLENQEQEIGSSLPENTESQSPIPLILMGLGGILLFGGAFWGYKIFSNNLN